MAVSWNEIKERAIAFSKKWEDATNEDSEAKPFLIDFFNILGVSNRRVTSFEHRVEKSDYRYSASIVYNNFPWAENPTDKQIARIEQCATKVLEARALFVDSSPIEFLFDLYTKYNSTLFAKQPKIKKNLPPSRREK